MRFVRGVDRCPERAAFVGEADDVPHRYRLIHRWRQILDLICKGTQNKIIADRLGLSENTVKVHVRNIYKKMNVRNRTEAASRYFTNDAATERNGWTDALHGLEAVAPDGRTTGHLPGHAYGREQIVEKIEALLKESSGR